MQLKERNKRNMKKMIINKIITEYNKRTIGGRKLGSYRFEELVGFYTQLKNGKQIK